MTKCFIFRIDRENEFIIKELENGRLRQGWGTSTMSFFTENSECIKEEDWIKNYYWKDENIETKKRKYRNLKNLLNMDIGDVVVIPRYPEWEKFTIAKIQEKYKFEIPMDSDINDFGHILKIEEKKVFNYYHNGEARKISSKFGSYQSPINNVYNKEVTESIERLLANKDLNQDEVEEQDKTVIEMKKADDTFGIEASTYTLEKIIRKVTDEKIKFIIPIYQRPYSWGETEVKRLIDDIFESFYDIEQEKITIKKVPMFIGTMQLSAVNEKGGQEIIDGQQRITTLNLLLLALEGKKIGRFFKTDVGGQEELISLVFNEVGFDKESSNIYLQNYSLIKEELENSERGLEEKVRQELIDYIKNKLYFVVVETKASLTETLKIFDTINTSGLDLNGADIFKIKMYEYLHKIENRDKSIFNEIDGLYNEVYKRNEGLRNENKDYISPNITMSSILTLYKEYLISKNEIPSNFLKMSSDTFFEKLFDSLIRNKNIPDFISNDSISKIRNEKLDLKILKRIIDARFKWEELKEKLSMQTNFEENFIFWSRYSRYFSAVIFFILVEENYSEEKLKKLISKLAKLFIVYSVNYDKQINEINGFMAETYTAILVSTNFKDIIKTIDEKIKKEKEWFNNRLALPIADKATVKNLLCRVSGMSHELIKNGNIKETIKIIFKEKIDIEHIQSFNDENEDIRKELWDEWKDEINSIGNLIILESKINRSISNKSGKKYEGYKNSKYSIVKDFIDERKDINKTESLNWTFEDAKIRKEAEINKILKYIYEDIN